MDFDSMTDLAFSRWFALRFAGIFAALLALGAWLFPVTALSLAAIVVASVIVACYAVAFWYHATDDVDHHGFRSTR